MLAVADEFERQGAIMPVIGGLDREAVQLTTREAQLVELARQGYRTLRSPSVSCCRSGTVESHLYRAMQKLGVSDRRDL